MWRVMHSVAFTYPDTPEPETRKDYIDFFRSIGNVIPCPSCRTHYNKYLEENPIQGEDRESLARWVYDLHSTVNERTKKPNPSYEQVEQAYTGWTPDQDQGKSREQVIRELGDPHFGGRLTGGLERALGADQTEMAMAKLALFALLFLFIIVVVRRYINKQQQEGKK